MPEAPDNPKVETEAQVLGGGAGQTAVPPKRPMLERLAALLAGRNWWQTLKLGLAVVAALWLWFNFSPRAWYRWYYPPSGQIFVDSPEVYTRERLINERSSEEAWLYQKLAEADGADALAGVNRIIERELRLNSNAAPAPKPPSTGGGAGSGPGKAENKEEQQPAGGSYLTFDQTVRIASANRDLILQKIIENRLDDRHDLDGNSLYILKFDTTVVVNDYSDRRAMVRIGLYPPFETSDNQPLVPGADTRNIFGPAIAASDPTLEFMRSAFAQYLRDSASRLNNAIANGMTAADRDKRNSDFIIGIAAKEFGVDPGEVSIKINPWANDPAWMYYALDVRSLRPFVSFMAIQPSQGAFRQWKFSAPDQKDNFELLEWNCTRTQEAIDKREELRSLTDFEFDTGADKNHLAQYFDGPLSGQPNKVHLYSGLNGYFLQDKSYHADIETLLNRALTGKEKPGVNLMTAPLWTLNFYEQPLETGVDGKQFTRTDGGKTCRSITGSLRTGLMNFVARVSKYNQYTYSVLPKQSPVGIIDEVIDTIESRMAADSLPFGVESLKRSHTRGARLQSRVTSFGEMSDGSEKLNDDLKVGWIIDPRAGSTADPEDRTLTTVDSVMAIVSVPSWWPSLGLKIERTWLNPDGSEIAGEPPAANSGKPFPINLPSLQHNLESTLIYNDWRQPSIEHAFCQDRLTQDPTRQGLQNTPTCVITGTRLWRNPVVLLGAVRHNRLSVLPNMKGLLVEFPPDARTCRDKVTVWTSEGMYEKQPDNCTPDTEAAALPGGR